MGSGGKRVLGAEILPLARSSRTMVRMKSWRATGPAPFGVSRSGDEGAAEGASGGLGDGWDTRTDRGGTARSVAERHHGDGLWQSLARILRTISTARGSRMDGVYQIAQSGLRQASGGHLSATGRLSRTSAVERVAAHERRAR